MERKIYFGILMTLCVASTAMSSFGQQRTELQKKRDQHLFYRRTLQVDSVKAAQVAKVQDDYKLALKTVLADSAQTQLVKRERIKALIDAKNQKLKQLLTPAQQEKIIPTTERIPSKAKAKL